MKRTMFVCAAAVVAMTERLCDATLLNQRHMPTIMGESTLA